MMCGLFSKITYDPPISSDTGLIVKWLVADPLSYLNFYQVTIFSSGTAQVVWEGDELACVELFFESNSHDIPSLIVYYQSYIKRKMLDCFCQ